MLDRLKLRPGARHRKKRVGRGPGSGMGKTAARGEKGQGHRSPGRETPLFFEGGQMPLVRRLPKRVLPRRPCQTRSSGCSQPARPTSKLSDSYSCATMRTSATRSSQLQSPSM